MCHLFRPVIAKSVKCSPVSLSHAHSPFIPQRSQFHVLNWLTHWWSPQSPAKQTIILREQANEQKRNGDDHWEAAQVAAETSRYADRSGWIRGLRGGLHNAPVGSRKDTAPDPKQTCSWSTVPRHLLQRRLWLLRQNVQAGGAVVVLEGNPAPGTCGDAEASLQVLRFRTVQEILLVWCGETNTTGGSSIIERWCIS